MSWRASVSSKETSNLIYRDIEQDPDLKARVEQKLLEEGYELIQMSESTLSEGGLSYMATNGDWTKAHYMDYRLNNTQTIFRRKKRG